MAVMLDRVVVIGAGIGGLSAAIALRQAGYTVTVYERAPSFGTVGAGLTLWANAIRVLKTLGIAEETLGGAKVRQAAITDWQGIPFASTDLIDLEPRLGGPTYAVHRADVHQALLSMLPDGVVQTGREFVRFVQSADSVTAYFKDGHTDTAGLLVGADGIHSAVRKQLYPQVMPRYSGYAAWRGVIEASSILEQYRTQESWGRGARFGIVPIGNQRIYWFAAANRARGLQQTPHEHKTELLRIYRGWHTPVEQLIDATPEDQILYNDIFDMDPMIRWGDGRVTLLGDAAHPTTPNMGQGACQAIESALVLARCLSAAQEEHKTALQTYEILRRPRTAWITRQSRMIGRMGQMENPLAVKARDFLLRHAPPSTTTNQLVKAAGHLL